MEVLMSLDTLASRCGHFFNCNLTPGFEDKPNVNNGYNCDHPECGDAEDGIGKCLASACPVAYKASCKTCGMAGVQCEEAGNEEDAEYCEDDTMVCEIPDEDFDERKMIRVPDGDCNITTAEPEDKEGEE